MRLHKEVRASRPINRILQHGCSPLELKEKLRAIDFLLLLDSLLITMEELYRWAYRYSTLEDNIRATTQTLMITNQLAEKNRLVGKKPSTFKEGQSRDRKRPRDQSHKRRELP